MQFSLEYFQFIAPGSLLGFQEIDWVNLLSRSFWLFCLVELFRKKDLRGSNTKYSGTELDTVDGRNPVDNHRLDV